MPGLEIGSEHLKWAMHHENLFHEPLTITGLIDLKIYTKNPFILKYRASSFKLVTCYQFEDI